MQKHNKAQLYVSDWFNNYHKKALKLKKKREVENQEIRS